jgi:hypothetical protein
MNAASCGMSRLVSVRLGMLRQGAATQDKDFTRSESGLIDSQHLAVVERF